MSLRPTSRSISRFLAPYRLVLGRLVLGLLVLGLALAPAPASAQASASATGWHTVRNGDTLRALSRQYSGAEARWVENWKLNPEVKDPDHLTPGQRLRLILSQVVPENVARITQIARTVEAKANPNPWDAALLDELLRDQDALRTFARSSAEMAFHDGSQLQVTESSLIFLRRVGQQLRGVGRDEIEIVEGQVDLGGSLGRPDAGVDIVLGPVRANPKPGSDGKLQTRVRKGEGGAAQMMIYAGESAVEAGGAKVAVAAGMGTVVPHDAPPNPPEKLLPAPQPQTPAAGAVLEFADPDFTWSAVPGAVSYTVEVCADPACGRLERRVVGLTATQAAREALPLGSFFWRVTATAPSGLDGYPSEPRAFAILADRVDHEAPKAVIQVTGPQMRCGSLLVLGQGARLRLEPSDAGAGVGVASFQADGKAIDTATWGGAWAAGQHTTEAVVTDSAGNRGSSGPLVFVSDVEAPEVQWETGNRDLFQLHGEPDRSRTQGTSAREERKGRSSRRREEARPAAWLEWSSDGRRWLPLRPGSGREPGGLANGDRPQIFLRAIAGDIFAPGAPVHLGAERIARVSAVDSVCGVEQLRFGIGSPARAGQAGSVLWIEAVDPLGNLRALEWPLTVNGR